MTDNSDLPTEVVPDVGGRTRPQRPLRTGAEQLSRVLDTIGSVDPIELALAPLLERFDVKAGRLYQPLRVAITGTSVSPGIFESLATLGREETLKRIGDAEARLAAGSDDA